MKKSKISASVPRVVLVSEDTTMRPRLPAASPAFIASASRYGASHWMPGTRSR
jgi:hypothetical protein